MPTSSGPNTLGESNLVFAIDTHDTSNGITPLGCGGFVGSTQGVKNILTGTTFSFTNGMKLSGRTYYTAFAIDYPESSYGGDGAGRQGITPGYDVRSGGKLYDASRALHLWVFNNDTNSWIDNGATTYFRGARLAGHCYDNYSGAETGYLNEIGLFISDYNAIKSAFPNCTFVVMGSHRADQYTAALRTILYDLGMPTGYIDSDYIAAPEWILIGEPGLGTGNAFGWVYENYTTNAAQVAHINFGLPIKARGGMEFDGTNDKIDINSSFFTGTENNVTFECIIKLSANQTSTIFLSNYTQASSATGLGVGISDSTTNKVKWFTGNLGTTNTLTSNTTLSNGTYYHVVGTYNGSSKVLYINGISEASTTLTNAINITSAVASIGYLRYLNNQYLNGEIPVAKIYNRALTAQEVRQNYQQYKTRFNLS
jgi:hypothetical protein